LRLLEIGLLSVGFSFKIFKRNVCWVSKLEWRTLKINISYKDCKLLFYKLKNTNMEKLVFDYTYCSEPECWEWNIPFEYESKEKFIFDVLENPMILNKIGISVYEHQLEPKIESHLDYITNVDEYVFTLEEWFNKNKTII